ncbi:hypothetical protein RHSIM_Rhsim04G0191700 [Rhododendron simsii]|uniref:Uncharacterized protein n=1 Tax=Rhododendron simsii TaxID=118357 RepID=A0A834H0W7_RHOSS|nr:hypothetical protein RHSIM_Rhsim04G0191700 [Rhododendron simsii]
MIRTRIEDLSFGTFSSMLLAEELHISQDDTTTSTILVAPHQTSVISNPNTTSSSSSGLLPTPPSISMPAPPPPFQFPFQTSSPQNYLPSFQPNYSGPRFNRNNNNRSRGNQFGTQFGNHSGSVWNGSPGPGWNSFGARWNGTPSPGFQGPYGFPSNFNYQYMPEVGGMSGITCQICGKPNHQASTCRHRANLGYRPFGQFGRPSFGQSAGCPYAPQFGPQSGSNTSQAFYTFSDPMGYYNTGFSVDQPSYALHMPDYSNSAPASSQLNGVHAASHEGTPSSYGSSLLCGIEDLVILMLQKVINFLFLFPPLTPQHLLNSYTFFCFYLLEVEFLWWMDSDAMFTDMAFEIPWERYVDHNFVLHGWEVMVYDWHSWVGLNTDSFLLRHCQWSLDILDVWAPMGPKAVREEAGRLLTRELKDRPVFEADDQSAMVYILATQKEKWGDKVYIESEYHLYGYWAILVDRYEEMIETYHPGLGDHRWPLVTHFVGCKPCGKFGEYSVERCLKQMDRAFNFGDNQIMQMYGFTHKTLESRRVKRTRNETTNPLEIKDELGLLHSEFKATRVSTP